ncbi:hypothetical protein EMIHUDRAFT_250346 [Emiliania huxleyi CCMP1516]|uniref:Uncharacterized protein n=2 Tax=Emiliania huxleyi TaxID=2903 RepID=A0A0D3I1B2_EMIH1|nr:hypothetical protein EMIHUDRAFT_250346 [Emiliania huxleyi CCMP1516]EOD05047.1 hypothetical protein EMIHUDRAFT_250346 [Emiliania huxleyi CCMP1516]|eukprot:XP_005757476.1 hypothetical protein EMIHUDRAFT_250346 [Emiliania huxleyi CCMP1516]
MPMEKNSFSKKLPKEAFLSLKDLIEAGCPHSGLSILALSYPWLTPEHPDPDGANLCRVAKALEALINDEDEEILRFGVFWDYLSLHQHPDPANGIMRTEAENALFKKGLGYLGTLYSHQHTTVLRLTSFPEGHRKEDQREGANVAEYFDRGWCFTENALSSLSKGSGKSLDLGKMTGGAIEHGSWGILEGGTRLALVTECVTGGGRRPPLLPSRFAAELETKSFTNGKDDKPLVKGLYEGAFKEQFGNATELRYMRLGWGEEEAAQVAEVIASGATPLLEELDLAGNQIGDDGLKALAAALGREGSAPRLQELDLTSNQIGDDGLMSLAAALSNDGVVPRLANLILDGNRFGNEGLKALVSALSRESGASQLQRLEFCSNEIGDEGLKALAAAFGGKGCIPRLTELDLRDNQIGVEGFKALASALRQEGAFPSLKARAFQPHHFSVRARHLPFSPSWRVSQILYVDHKPWKLWFVCKRRGIILWRDGGLFAKATAKAGEWAEDAINRIGKARRVCRLVGSC